MKIYIDYKKSEFGSTVANWYNIYYIKNYNLNWVVKSKKKILYIIKERKKMKNNEKIGAILAVGLAYKYMQNKEKF